MKSRTSPPPSDPIEKQRVVQTSIGGGSPIVKPAGAVSSVFDAGKKAKPDRPPLPLLDPAKVVIRKGVPIPELLRGHQSRAALYEAVWNRLEPGAMVELENRHADAMRAWCKKHNKSATLRRLQPGVKGLWRTDPAVGPSGRRSSRAAQA